MKTIKNDRFILKLLELEKAHLVCNYFLKNQEHLKKTMPYFGSTMFEIPHWEKTLKQNLEYFKNKKALRLFILNPDETEVLGTINFTEFRRGVYQGCFLGYGIAKKHEGKGLMTEALNLAINYVFKELNFHKILANYMPLNKKSGRVLQKLGFHEVGLAKQELFLDGQWQDHIETRLINDNWSDVIS